MSENGLPFAKENSLIVGTGHVLGLGSLLLNTRSLFNIRAKTAINVAFISREDIHKLSLKYPKIVSTLAKRMLDGAPTLMRKLEFALDWDEISAGRTIYDQGDDRYVTVELVTQNADRNLMQPFIPCPPFWPSESHQEKLDDRQSKFKRNRKRRVCRCRRKLSHATETSYFDIHPEKQLTGDTYGIPESDGRGRN